MSVDLRGWRMALIADALLNPHDRDSVPDVFGILEASGYGILQLPPAAGSHDLLLSVTADQVAEYSHHGYAVAAIGIKSEVESGVHWRRLTDLLQERNSKIPPLHEVTPGSDTAEEARRVASFLTAHDVSEEEKSRWRV